jgi:hypothetical protein
MPHVHTDWATNEEHMCIVPNLLAGMKSGRGFKRSKRTCSLNQKAYVLNLYGEWWLKPDQNTTIWKKNSMCCNSEVMFWSIYMLWRFNFKVHNILWNKIIISSYFQKSNTTCSSLKNGWLIFIYIWSNKIELSPELFWKLWHSPHTPLTLSSRQPDIDIYTCKTK